MPLHNLSPSRLARYFYHECPRYLRFHATPARARPAAGIPAPVPAASLVTAAILERGCEWEETVVREKLVGWVQVAPGPGRLHQRSFSPRETLTRLTRLAPGEALYQPTLEPPPTFLNPWKPPWGGDPIHTLDDFERLLQDPDPGQVDAWLSGCGQLRHRRERLSNSLRALREQTVIAHGGSSLALPVNEQVKIVLTLQHEPHSGAICAAGLLRLKGQDVYGTGAHSRRFIAARPEDCDRVAAEFLSALFAELQTLHDYNRVRSWAEQHSLQVYVYDSYEETLFYRLLIEALNQPALARYALPLLFYFQDEHLVREPEHPATEAPYPIVVLTRVIRQLAALPNPLALRLPEVLEALPAPGFAYTLNPGELFWFSLSNTMKSDALYLLWRGSHPEAQGWIEAELDRRLWAASAVVDGLRAKVQDHLFAWPLKFLFPGPLVFQHPTLSRLAFIVRYESFMQAMKTREARTGPWDERVQAGVSIPVRGLGHDRWAVQSTVSASRVEPDGFLNFLLVPAGDAGERAQMSYHDYRYRRAMYSLPKQDLWLAGVTAIERNAAAEITHLRLTHPRGGHPFRPGDEAVLHPRFTDFTSDRIIDCLSALDTQPDHDFLALLHDPAGFAVPVAESPALHQALAGFARQGFTPSQQRAFQQFIGRRLTLIWGPPGTGKTYFLARALLYLLAACHQVLGEARLVGVTAFTHAAVENLLLELTDAMRDTGLGRGLAVYKLGGLRTQRARDRRLPALAEKEVAGLPAAQPVVLGGTVYGFRKAREHGLPGLDVLIVDEASQLKFGEFALAVAGLAPYRGRLLLGGDDLQLPPIIQGVYPPPEDGLPGLHDSVFAWLRPWASPPFVDTVDKMQGQQSRVVIVSYGVSDLETALQEGEFIYSRNRLNVSITRARAKCLVFLPRPLLEPAFDLLQNEAAAQGLGFMQALADYCGDGQPERRRRFILTVPEYGRRVGLTVLRAGGGA